jgi:hypothetical protein
MAAGWELSRGLGGQTIWRCSRSIERKRRSLPNPRRWLCRAGMSIRAGKACFSRGQTARRMVRESTTHWYPHVCVLGSRERYGVHSYQGKPAACGSSIFRAHCASIQAGASGRLAYREDEMDGHATWRLAPFCCGAWPDAVQALQFPQLHGAGRAAGCCGEIFSCSTPIVAASSAPVLSAPCGGGETTDGICFQTPTLGPCGPSWAARGGGRLHLQRAVTAAVH